MRPSRWAPAARVFLKALAPPGLRRADQPERQRLQTRRRRCTGLTALPRAARGRAACDCDRDPDSRRKGARWLRAHAGHRRAIAGERPNPAAASRGQIGGTSESHGSYGGASVAEARGDAVGGRDEVWAERVDEPLQRDHRTVRRQANRGDSVEIGAAPPAPRSQSVQNVQRDALVLPLSLRSHVTRSWTPRSWVERAGAVGLATPTASAPGC